MSRAGLLVMEGAGGPPDQAARESALDIGGSWIVQAPAGAGKTELLTQRFLKLLAAVDEPEEILAITFTRAATSEMRGRIVGALEEAARSWGGAGEAQSQSSAGGSQTLGLARVALAHSRARGWQLLEQPHRLDVQTIDSICMRLAHGQPLLSRLGGKLEPAEQAGGLYELAAERTLAQLGQGGPGDELEAALRHLLLLRDNNLEDCRRLLAGMLEQREHWRHVFVLSGQGEVDWEAVRRELEAPFAAEIRRVLGELHGMLSAEPVLVGEMLELARYACGHGSRAEIALLDGLHDLPAPEAEFVAHWGCVRNFLLTKDKKGGWRKQIRVTDGFPVGDGSYRGRMKSLLREMQSSPRLGERLRLLLRQAPKLPDARYTEGQWETLVSVFRVLRRAVAELHVVFAERNQVDFAELSIAALAVLEDPGSSRGLWAASETRHLLIDEFQDTSRRQHRLIGRLLGEWQTGDGRTCFLVGDPMQSIYLFRQAEVELFGRVEREGLDCGGRAHLCGGLRLSENFRSHRGLVEPLNRYFAAIFGDSGGAAGGGPGEVPFAPSTAARAGVGVGERDAVRVHAFFCDSREVGGKDRARERQVARVVELVREELPRIAAARADWEQLPQVAAAGGAPGYTVAILGRARSHLAPIAAALREAKIGFRAVELETLAERQEIVDLRSLVRALLHPMERIAWLSVLRAPWCGLTLGDLHVLAGSDEPGLRYAPVAELMASRGHLLSPDGRGRLERVARVLERAREESFRRVHAQSLAAWVERTWTSLGAPAYLTEEERENAETFFRLLDTLPPDGMEVLNGTLDRTLEKLCAAPDSSVDERFGVQLMTIHKAKGLGFEVVIVPGLERRPGQDETPLVTLLERIGPGAEDEVLVAPVGARGEQHRTYKWVQAARRAREAGERKRVLYVACTRARRQLHLLGTAEVGASGVVRPGAAESLLACGWPAFAGMFEEAYAAERRGGVVSGEAGVGEAGLGAPEPGYVERLAAAAGSAAAGGAAAGSAAAGSGLWLSRVPAGFVAELGVGNVRDAGAYPRMGTPGGGREDRFARPEGSFEQRARGNAVHAMLELMSERWAREGRAGAPGALAGQLERVGRASLRRAGLTPARVEAITPALVAIVLTAAGSAEGRWILSPRAGARSEWSFSRWTGGSDGSARLGTLRVDRVFRAGESVLSEGSRCLWVIDYKTGAEPGGIGMEAYLEGQKEQWRPQLEAYGGALRAALGEALELRYGLYFPELLRLKVWL